MKGHDYEYVAAQYLRNHGYKFVEVTKASGDYGVDVIAHKGPYKYAVQCKYYSSPVGVSAVQEAVAGKAMYDCDRAMVITNSTYTKAAEKLADKNNVVLLSEIDSSEGGSKLGNKIGTFLWVFFSLAVLSFFYYVYTIFKEQSLGKTISMILLFLLLGTFSVLLYVYIKRILSLKGRLSKAILAFCCFMFSLWNLETFLSIPELFSVADYTGLLKAIFTNVLSLGAVALIVYFTNKYKKKHSVDVDDLTDTELPSFSDLDDDTLAELFIAAIPSKTQSETQYEQTTIISEAPINNTTDYISPPPPSNSIVIDPEQERHELLQGAKRLVAKRKAIFEDFLVEQNELAQKCIELGKEVEAERTRIEPLLVPTFKAYKAEIELIKSYCQKNAIMFNIKPKPGIKIDKIKNVLLDVSAVLGISELKMLIDNKSSTITIYTVTDINFPEVSTLSPDDFDVDKLAMVIVELFYTKYILSIEVSKKLNLDMYECFDLFKILKVIGVIGKTDKEILISKEDLL